MHFVKIAAFLSPLVLAGCATRSTPGEGEKDIMATWRMDNPAVRKLQEEETGKYFPDTSTQKHLKKSIGPCVELLYETRQGNLTGLGRAVAVTSDGYYLTAYHVVDDGQPFFTLEYIEKQPPPTPGTPHVFDDYYATKYYRGRIVWSDPVLDLAILKFGRTDIPHIEKMRLHPNRNELVYSTDERGMGVSPPVGKNGTISWKDLTSGLVGNGPFFSAGKVISSENRKSEARSMAHRLTLVARGGMSGGPLLTIDNALCGILVEGSVHRDLLHWSRLIPRSSAVMIDPAFVTAKIQEDRAGQASAPSL